MAGRMPGVEEVGLEEDLAVGDGDDVRGDVGRDVAGLGLDDGQRGEAASALLGVELGRALEQAAVQIEDVAGIGLAAGGPAQEQRDLAVGRGLLGEVVVDAEGVLAVVAEVLADGAARVGGDVEEGRGVGGGGADHDGVLHGPVLLEGADDLGHRRVLLPDGHVDADDALALLVDDRVEGHRGLAGLAVADDELALAAADGDHGVDGLEARLQRLFHRAAVDDPGGDALDGSEPRGLDRALAVEGQTEGVHHPPHHRFAHGHGHDALRALDLVAFLDEVGLAQEHDAHRVFLEVHGEARHPVGQLEQLARHAVVEAVDPGDAVADLQDGAHLRHVDGGGVARELLADDLGDLFGANLHLSATPVRCHGRADSSWP